MSDGSSCSGCGEAQAGTCNGPANEDHILKERLGKIKHKIVVISGKGGVGKSTVAVNLAVSLSLSGRKVGLLDVDIHGPSIPNLLGLQGVTLQANNKTISPARFSENLKVMSIGFLLNSRDEAIIWRGPMKMGVINQFLKDVEWGDLDYLVVDSPPGTGDEPLSICQLIEDADGAVIVTTPQNVSLLDVRKSINFCKKLDMNVLGIVENMSGFACPECNKVIDIFKKGGGEIMALEMDVRYLGSIPLDPVMVTAGDSGRPFVHHYARTETAKSFEKIVMKLSNSKTGSQETIITGIQEMNDKNIKIAVPVAEGRLAQHFGHCEQFLIFDVDTGKKVITDRMSLTPPPHEPGILPPWLKEQGADIIITGGMGGRALQLFRTQDVEVITGAMPDLPENVVKNYLNGSLRTGENVCDH